MNSAYEIETARNNNGLLCFRLGYQRIAGFTRADTIEALVSSSTNLTKGDQYNYFKPWLGFGLLTR